MPLLDILKKKKKEKKEEGKKILQKQKGEPIIIKKEKRIGEAYRFLKSPHISEKATDLTGKNQYVFKVYPEVNKTEVKKAIENMYGIEVISVRVINVPQKRRRLGRTVGWRKGYKKAIVRVREGQKIEVLPR